LKLSFGVTQTPQKEQKSQIQFIHNNISFWKKSNDKWGGPTTNRPMAPGEGEDRYPSYPTDRFDTGL
jgi:hypothetical protein